MSTDLVLTLTRDHRSILLSSFRQSCGAPSILLEFANLATKLDLTDVPENLSMGDRLREIAPLAADQRSVLGMWGRQSTFPIPSGEVEPSTGRRSRPSPGPPTRSSQSPGRV